MWFVKRCNWGRGVVAQGSELSAKSGGYCGIGEGRGV